MEKSDLMASAPRLAQPGHNIPPEPTGQDEDPEFGTVKAACKMIGGDKPINVSTYYRGCKSGLYEPPVHFGRIARVPLRKLRARLRRIAEAADR